MQAEGRARPVINGYSMLRVEISENHAQFTCDDHQNIETAATKCHKKRNLFVFSYLQVTTAHTPDLMVQRSYGSRAATELKLCKYAQCVQCAL